MPIPEETFLQWTLLIEQRIRHAVTEGRVTDRAVAHVEAQERAEWAWNEEVLTGRLEAFQVARQSYQEKLNRVSYTVAGQANLSRSLERNTELQVQLDKPSYSGGDTISVSIRAPYACAELITVERERVFQYQWFKATTTSLMEAEARPRRFLWAR